MRKEVGDDRSRLARLSRLAAVGAGYNSSHLVVGLYVKHTVTHT
jgi:hypothetical protein